MRLGKPSWPPGLLQRLVRHEAPVKRQTTLVRLQTPRSDPHSEHVPRITQFDSPYCQRLITVY